MIRTRRRRRPQPDRLWDAHVGTAQGALHQSIGLPNQDAVAIRSPGHPGVLAAAVADGHGSPRHFRSGQGAALAVDAGCRAALRLAARLPRMNGHPADVLKLSAARLAGQTLHDWRRAVVRHRAAHPYSPTELGELGDHGDGSDVPYGSTLLICLAAGRWLVCAQIGDGDLLAVLPDGRPLSPIPHDGRLDGVSTTSLCLPGAEHDFRFGVCDLTETPVRAVLLATDGYSNAQRAEPWQPAVAADLALLADEHDGGWFAHHVPRWAELCASAAGSGDDTTLALLVRHEGG